MKGVLGAGLFVAVAAALFPACSSKATTIGQTRNEDASVPSCSAGCIEASVYPVDYGRNCVDLSKKELVGCWCEGSAHSNCRIRKSDGKLFLGDTTSLFRPDDFGVCSAVGDPMVVPENSCDFENCATPPPSSCSVADTCAVLPCNGPLFDSNGCMRAFCSNDSDCPSADRCVYAQCQNASTCSYAHDGTCQCSGPEPCVPARFCSPTADYGPRGDWIALEFHESYLGGSATYDWRLTPDGQMTMSSAAGSASTNRITTLPQGELSEVVDLVDGPELRPSLRDGMTCGLPPTDVYTTMKLELTTGALEGDVTGCVEPTNATDNAAKRIFDLLHKR